MPAEIPANEAERLKLLHNYRIIDTLPEQVYEEIVHSLT